MNLFKRRQYFIKETKSLINSFKFAFRGIYKSFAFERNMKIHYFMMILVIIMGLFFKITKMEWIICIILFGLVISAEMVNTAIESVVDLVTKEEKPLAGLAKDVAAGAVLVLALISLIVGLIIFMPYITEFISKYN